MALTFTWEQVLSVSAPVALWSSAGVYELTDRSLVAGIGHATLLATEQRFYRSFDNGDTWEHMSTLPVQFNDVGPRLLKFTPNILIYAVPPVSEINLDIWRSTNGGETWSLQHVFDGAPGFAGFTGLSFGGASNQRSTALVTGWAPESNGSLVGSVARGENLGQSWSRGPALAPSGVIRPGYACATAPGGLVIAATNRRGVFYSTNYGANFTQSSPLPSPPNVSDILLYDACWLDNTTVLAGGIGAGVGAQNESFLYRSVNAGVDWTRVLPTDITFPGAPNNDFVFITAKRLNKDTAVFGLLSANAARDHPLIWTFDRGLTWSDASGAIPVPGTEDLQVGRAICVSSSGQIFIVIDHFTPEGETSGIWRATVTC